MGDVNVSTADTVEICGDATEVLYVTVVDAYGHDHELVLAVDDADELAGLLALAVAQ